MLSLKFVLWLFNGFNKKLGIALCGGCCCGKLYGGFLKDCNK